MPERPLILFPKYDTSDRESGSGGPTRFRRPSLDRQGRRFQPVFTELQRGMEQRRIQLHNDAIGLEPECALVFEVVGNVDSFYGAVNRTEGFEWMFDVTADNIESDDDFHSIDRSGNDRDSSLPMKVYCVMSNKRALDELISLWSRYVTDPTMQFQHGYAGLRDVFINLRDIRYWNASDRFDETQVLDYWREDLEIVGAQEVKCELELFYRNGEGRRSAASNIVRSSIEAAGGRVIDESVISGIRYHGMLTELPRNCIEALIEDYNEVELANVDDIMFFRPVGQIICDIEVEEDYESINNFEVEEELSDEPIAALFDGMPLQNHLLLQERLIIDDPLGWGEAYPVAARVHGTAMASLILHSDVYRDAPTIKSKLYVRPIMKPQQDINGKYYERIPDDVLLVDLIHTAVRRLFEGIRVAPSVKVINLSIGDPARQFVNSMSPLARILDWLSTEYGVLFIVSAGNHNLAGLDLDISFNEFKELSMENRETKVLQHLSDRSRNQRLLSPAESINAITVGATFDDYTEVTENDRHLIAYENPLTSPISAIGHGYNRAIKPDLFFNGGRKLLMESYTEPYIRWVKSNANKPGCMVATPGAQGDLNNYMFTFGTSDATAQMTYEAVKCYETLEDVFNEQTEIGVPHNYSSVLLKAMLAHSSEWSNNVAFVNALNINENRLMKWQGNGQPDTGKVFECDDNRITLIGYGSLEKGRAHQYELPIPIDFTTGRYFRKLTVTLAYFAPTTSSKQKYRSAKLWFTLESNSLVSDRVNTDHNSVRRGTLQHEIFCGESATTWDSNDKLRIKVNCMDDAETRFNPVNYGLLVSFEIAKEIAAELGVDVYERVIDKVREAVPIQNRN